jgi:hypothetical protein
VVWLLPLALLGVATGTAGVALHQSPGWLGVTFLAGAATTAALPARLRLAWALGFAAPLVVLSWPRAAGDVVLTGTSSLLLACQAALWVGIGFAGLAPPPRPRRAGPVPEEPGAAS